MLLASATVPAPRPYTVPTAMVPAVPLGTVIVTLAMVPAVAVLNEKT